MDVILKKKKFPGGGGGGLYFTHLWFVQKTSYPPVV